MTAIYVDGRLPAPGEEVHRVAGQLGLAVCVVANGSRPIRPPGVPNVTMITVAEGADVADDWIAVHVTEADVYGPVTAKLCVLAIWGDVFPVRS